MTHSPPHSPGQDMEFVLDGSSSQQRHLPLSPAQFDSHARTSRSHSLRWPRGRLFLKTYKLLVFARTHWSASKATQAWPVFGYGKYEGNASALLGIKHDRHRNVACGGWWGPFMADSLELTGQAGFRDTRGPTGCQAERRALHHPKHTNLLNKAPALHINAIILINSVLARFSYQTQIL